MQIVPEKPEPAATEGQNLAGCPPVSVDPEAPGARFNDPNLLSLEHRGWRVMVGFHCKEMPDESRVSKYRAQLLDFVRQTNCKSLTFDMRGIKIVPSRMLGFFVSLKNEGHDIELVDMEQQVQDIFRVTKLASMFTIRPIAK